MAFTLGKYEIFNIDEKTGIWTPVFSRSNLDLYGAGSIAAQCIGLGKSEYRIRTVYLEFANSSTAVTPPAFDRTGGIDYYNGLASVTDWDYLRVAISQDPSVQIASGYESYYSDPSLGNELVFTAQSSGTTGVHGTPFSSANNSRVIGLAIVASPDFADPTKDIVYARDYFAQSQQIPKQASSQIGVIYKISFPFV